MSENLEKGILYLVPTPIGNLGDITRRALDILKSAEIVACEDTRHSGKLLAHFGLKKKLISYHDFNEEKRLPQLLNILGSGGDIAVITDAGSPGLSDPAFRIIRAAIQNNIKVSPLPGANALIPALTGSGLPLDRFFFEGFLPNRSAARKKRLESLQEMPHTLIFYESPHRIAKTVSEALEILGDRPACIARELSKIHEEFIRGSLGQLNDILNKRKLKGEIVLLTGGLHKTGKKKNG